MNYEKLEVLKPKTDEEAQLAAELADAVETTIENNSFKGRPRSVRFLGAGLGCMEFFYHDGCFYAARNTGEDIDIIELTDDLKGSFIEIIMRIYRGREDENFVKNLADELFK
ncbi:MAG: hypothetical protein LUE12_04440 [Ruminococcus sp.]|nr:hypothetical protein [Ruminococcus sp.]